MRAAGSDDTVKAIAIAGGDISTMQGMTAPAGRDRIEDFAELKKLD